MKSPDRAEAVMLAFAAPALGWTNLDYGPYEPEVNEYSADSQPRDGLPFDMKVDAVPSCGECAHFRAGSGPLGRCGEHGVLVAPGTRCCEWYDAP